MSAFEIAMKIGLSEKDLSRDIGKLRRKKGDDTCHVCYEKNEPLKMVVCENGHTCCQKHHLERVRAIYQEGRSPYQDESAQKCFMCRCDMPDELFSDMFFNVLRVIQAVEIPKMMGKDIGHPLDQLRFQDQFISLGSA
jgi:hypothetical protein